MSEAWQLRLRPTRRGLRATTLALLAAALALSVHGAGAEAKISAMSGAYDGKPRASGPSTATPQPQSVKPVKKKRKRRR